MFLPQILHFTNYQLQMAATLLTQLYLFGIPLGLELLLARRLTIINKISPMVFLCYKNTHGLKHIRRSMVDWLDESISRNAERFFDLASEFFGDEYLVNFFGTKKDEA